MRYECPADDVWASGVLIGHGPNFAQNSLLEILDPALPRSVRVRPNSTLLAVATEVLERASRL